MKQRSQADRLASLIHRLLVKNYPSAVHLANESGLTDSDEKITLLDFPRLSICLSSSAKYLVMKNGVLSSITLKRGEAIVVPPNCVMEPHPEGRYLALGIVFMPQMTRYLFARKRPGRRSGSHQFLLSHHSQTVMDDDVKNFFAAINRTSRLPVDDLYMRRLVELILMKAKGMIGGSSSETALRKAYFTWKAACQFVHENLQHPIGRQDVASFLQLHPNHISRLFAQFGSGAFNSYLLKARLEKSRRLLMNANMNIGDIAAACGFTEANYFIRCFRKTYGDSPGRSRGV